MIMRLVKTSQDAKSDSALMDIIAKGDIHALGDLYLRHSNSVRAMLGYIAPQMTSHDVDDMTQEVFLSLGKSARSYVNQFQFKAFLFRIVVNRARDWQRRNWLRLSIFKYDSTQDNTVQTSVDESDPAKNAILRQTVRQAVKTLSPKQREVIILHAIEGFKCNEIATILSVSPKTVRTRLYRARQAVLQNHQIKIWREAMNERLQ